MECQRVVLEAMDSVVNVRSYIDRPIPSEVEDQLFHAFSLGSCLANTQPWELVSVQNIDQRKKLVDSTLDPFLTEGSFGSQSWLERAPLVIIVFIEKRRALARLGEKGVSFAVQDTYTAIQNFRLIAALHGLSTSCVREFDQARLNEHFHFPWYLEATAILVAGYSEEMKEIPPRLMVSDIVHREEWR